jgi:diacylglycerol kinase family enzyme
LKPTWAAGAARTLAAQAVHENYSTIIAAGGDGTVNEIVNGIGDVPGGFKRSQLALLPLGTANVLAAEHRIPTAIPAAWNVIQAGHEIQVDLPRVTFHSGERVEHRYFTQVAGAGPDARAVELVDWEVKKKIGPLAYVLAGIKALREPGYSISVDGGAKITRGGLVLVGNGHYYAGRFRCFFQADTQDGRLDVCVVTRVTWLSLVRFALAARAGRLKPGPGLDYLQTAHLELSSDPPAPLELDGDHAGWLPASFSLSQSKLRLIVPPPRAR